MPELSVHHPARATDTVCLSNTL